jgi:hypothetical protein
MGDIGRTVREVEFEPLEEPRTNPVQTPEQPVVPSEPVPA